MIQRPRLGRQVQHAPCVNLEAGVEAAYSPCGLYRYTLELHLGTPRPKGRFEVAVLLKNPSSADAQKADTTIRRAETLIHATLPHATHLTILNLYALRATDPGALATLLRTRGEQEGVGLENDHTLLRISRRAQLVVAAWGGCSGIPKHLYHKRIGTVLDLLAPAHPKLMRLSGKGSDLYPWHACFWPATGELIPLRP